MPTQTRSTGRFTRPGTPTSRPAGRSSRQAAGRFSRASSPSGRVSRPTTPSLRRRQPQQSGPKKALKAIGGGLPPAAAGKATKKTARAGKKPLGLAIVAGAAGLAFSQRDKIQSKLGGSKDETTTPVTTTPATTTGTGAEYAASPVA